MTVKRACGNCRFFTPPKPMSQCGLCTVRGSFAGTLASWLWERRSK